VALGQVFSENFGVPCQSTIHLPLHNHFSLSPGAGTIGVAAVPIASQTKKKKTPVLNDRPILSSERMLKKYYDHKCSV
jgi:hypothetical protein